MTPWLRRFGSALLPLSVTAVALAQAPVLDLRMGLWETTSETDFGGQAPGIDTSGLTAAQKAQIAAMTRGGIASQTTITHTCMTREKFNKSGLLALDQEGTTCTQKYTTNTRTALASTFTCTGTRAMAGQTRVDAPSPTSFTSKTTNSTTTRGRSMTVNITITGTWLAADCGTTK